MTFIDGAWYRLPDGARVRATQAARYWQFEAVDGTLCFIVTAYQVHQVAELAMTHIQHILPSEFQPSDFALEKSGP
jgi:hypothetical protein